MEKVMESHGISNAQKSTNPDYAIFSQISDLSWSGPTFVSIQLLTASKVRSSEKHLTSINKRCLSAVILISLHMQHPPYKTAILDTTTCIPSCWGMVSVISKQ